MTNAAIITPVLAAGSTTSPFVFDVNISQRLCFATCVAQTPVFTPVFTLEGYTSVGENAYVATVNVQGVICYSPCANNCSCATKAQLVNQTFSLPFYSGTAPTSVTIGYGKSINAMAGAPCQNCSRSFVSETPVTLSVA